VGGAGILLRTLFSNTLSFTPIQNNWQNYYFVYFNLYIPRHQAGRQKTLNRMVASIPRIQSALNLFLHANLIC
jgi:hypothetical protein